MRSLQIALSVMKEHMDLYLSSPTGMDCASVRSYKAKQLDRMIS